MADANKNSLKYKTPKLKDLLKGSGFEEIPKKIFSPETGDAEKGGKKPVALVLPAKKRNGTTSRYGRKTWIDC